MADVITAQCSSESYPISLPLCRAEVISYILCFMLQKLHRGSSFIFLESSGVKNEQCFLLFLFSKLDKFFYSKLIHLSKLPIFCFHDARLSINARMQEQRSEAQRILCGRQCKPFCFLFQNPICCDLIIMYTLIFCEYMGYEQSVRLLASMPGLSVRGPASVWEAPAPCEMMMMIQELCYIMNPKSWLILLIQYVHFKELPLVNL